MNNQDAVSTDQGITEISVQGFKSLYEESRLEIRSLTRYTALIGISTHSFFYKPY